MDAVRVCCLPRDAGIVFLPWFLPQLLLVVGCGGLFLGHVSAPMVPRYVLSVPSGRSS